MEGGGTVLEVAAMLQEGGEESRGGWRELEKTSPRQGTVEKSNRR